MSCSCFFKLNREPLTLPVNQQIVESATTVLGFTTIFSLIMPLSQFSEYIASNSKVAYIYKIQWRAFSKKQIIATFSACSSSLKIKYS